MQSRGKCDLISRRLNFHLANIKICGADGAGEREKGWLVAVAVAALREEASLSSTPLKRDLAHTCNYFRYNERERGCDDTLRLIFITRLASALPAQLPPSWGRLLCYY